MSVFRAGGPMDPGVSRAVTTATPRTPGRSVGAPPHMEQLPGGIGVSRGFSTPTTSDAIDQAKTKFVQELHQLRKAIATYEKKSGSTGPSVNIPKQPTARDLIMAAATVYAMPKMIPLDPLTENGPHYDTLDVCWAATRYLSHWSSFASFDEQIRDGLFHSLAKSLQRYIDLTPQLLEILWRLCPDSLPPSAASPLSFSLSHLLRDTNPPPRPTLLSPNLVRLLELLPRNPSRHNGAVSLAASLVECILAEVMRSTQTPFTSAVPTLITLAKGFGITDDERNATSGSLPPADAYQLTVKAMTAVILDNQSTDFVRTVNAIQILGAVLMWEQGMDPSPSTVLEALVYQEALPAAVRDAASSAVAKMRERQAYATAQAAVRGLFAPKSG